MTSTSYHLSLTPPTSSPLPPKITASKARNSIHNSNHNNNHYNNHNKDDGYYELLRQVIRTNEHDDHDNDQDNDNNNNNNNNNDWSIHCIDYKTFKKRFKFFIKRRIQMNNMILNSDDSKISEKMIKDLLGKQQQYNNNINNNNDILFQSHHDDEEQQNNDNSNNNSSNKEQSKKRKNNITKNKNFIERMTLKTFKNDSSNNISNQQQEQQQFDKDNNNTNMNTDCSSSSNNNDDVNNDDNSDESLSSFGYVQFVEPSISKDTTLDDNNNDRMDYMHTSFDNDEAVQISYPEFTLRNSKNKQHKRKGRISIMRRISVCERNEIISFLNQQLDKTVIFYLTQYQYIVSRIEELNDSNRIKIIVHNSYHNHNYNCFNYGDKQQQQEQQQSSSSLQHQHLSSNDDDSSFIILSFINEIKNEIIELMLFCIINIITIQQILIRYDTLAYQLDNTPSLFNYYMKHIIRSIKKKNSKNSTPFNRILYHSELIELSNQLMMEWNVIALSLSSKKKKLSSSSSSIPTTQQEPPAGTATTNNAAGIIYTYIDHIYTARQLFQNILHSLRSTTDGTSLLPQQQKSLSIITDNDIRSPPSNSKSYYDNICDAYQSLLLQSTIKARIGLETADLSIRENQNSLIKQMDLLVQWRIIHKQQQHDPSSYDDSRCDDQKESTNAFNKNHSFRNKAQLSNTQIYHLSLNLLSGFLYCMNYYIVEPSSTMYVNRLNAYDAMSGTLIGMMPLAAFISAIPYSYGTNQSFRYPFLISCCMLIIGNIVYSIADIYGHLYIALLGRFLCGLGAPKCIIRRYMADSTPIRLRTSVNALYAMVLGVGSAMGPFMAIILNRYNYTIFSNGTTIITLNGLTLPGYFMASLWLLFFVIILFTFQEPNRDGLHEQKELETMNNNNNKTVIISNSLVSMEDANHNNVNNTSTTSAAIIDDDRSTSNNSESNNSTFSFDSNYNFNTGGLIPPDSVIYEDSIYYERYGNNVFGKMIYNVDRFISKVTLSVMICLGLLFAKVFTIEALASATSTLTKNRYGWQIQQVGTLGFINGILVIPFSILIGKLSMTFQDHILMKWLVVCGCIGLCQLIDLSDIFYGTPTSSYNKNMTLFLSVTPKRYIIGYFMAYISIQAFEGVIGSTLSKVIPTSLASGTFNSGLLATLVDTFGRACGDMFISAMGYISLRQLMNLLFIPAFGLMITCLIVIERCRDILSV